MSRLQKLMVPFVLKWVPLLCSKPHYISSNPYLHCNGSGHILQHLRFVSTKSVENLKCCGTLGKLSKKSRLFREEAQEALLEYFHYTRSFDFMDAENMSKNTPDFLEKLLRRVKIVDASVGPSLTRFLRYNPINEFEPFFESIGLKPSEYSSFLPQNLMFLSDDELFLENYHVLCNYGIARNRIGKIYREAREVFWYDYGVLLPKLQSFQKLGLNKSLINKIVASSPRLLIGNVDRYFIEVLEYLKKSGIEYEWLEQHINMDCVTYDWKRMLKLKHLLHKSGLSEEQFHQIFMLHPDIFLEGRLTFCLFSFLLKFGSTPRDIQNLFLEFPDIPIAKFMKNLLSCYGFLVEINMDPQDIGRIMCVYPTVLGSCKLKTAKSLLSLLSCGEKSLCQTIKDNPHILKKWVLGVKVNPLHEQSKVVNVKIQKTEFLSSLGFVENSKEMELALKKLRGKGEELQERFDCLVKCGLSREEVTEMIKETPQILTQSVYLLEAKVNFFVKELGYQLSDLVGYPRIMSYTIERVKLRLLMYKWLKDNGSVRGNLAFSTLLSSSEEGFVKVYVNSHPKGHVYWNRLKKEVDSE